MPKERYKWNETKTDIYSIDNENNEKQNIKLIYDFFKSINTNNLGPGLIKNLYNNGYKKIKDIINIKKEDLLKIDGIKEILAEKLINNINESLHKCSIIQIMNGSNIFGAGFGIKKLENIYYNIKDVLIRTDKDKILNEILNLKGFNEKTGKQFILNLEKLQEFIKELNLEHKILNIKNIKNDKNIVLSGFRNKNLEKHLLKYNIDINENINNNTIYIVKKDNNINNTKKIIEGEKKQIKIITEKELLYIYK